jgi:DNA transformation protein and related proteins
MASSRAFHDYVVDDLLIDVDGVTSKGMFGGFGLYRNGKIFGLILGDELQIKVSGAAREELEKLGGRPFEYTNKKGTVVTMPYTILPASILEDRTQLTEWVERATSA